MTVPAAILKSLRPWQWSKNVLVFSALFLSGNLFNPLLAVKATAGFILFCLVSSAIYLLNDIIDAELDQAHPEKCNRPIAAGIISKGLAGCLSAFLCLTALGIAAAVNKGFFILLFCYVLLLSVYSLGLKKIVIIDTLVIAVGFLFRVKAGAVVIDVFISSWILMSIFFLALFIALNKRRHELMLLGKASARHRPVLARYSPYLLDQMITVSAALTIISYALYTCSKETIEITGSNNLIFSILFVLYGVFRYLYLVYKKHLGGMPAMTITTDFPTLAAILLWTITAGVSIYS